MKIVKYLFRCLVDFLADAAFFKDFVFGAMQVVLYCAVLCFSYWTLRSWCGFSEILATVYGALTTVGFIIALYGLICIVELTVRLIIKIKRKHDKTGKEHK